MPRILKLIIYLMVFVVSFLIFLYWMFPYDILKSRVASTIEEPFGSSVEVTIGEIEPYYFTGVAITKLSLTNRTDDGNLPMIELDKVRARVSLFSLLFGNPNLSFLIRSGKGEIEGEIRQTEEGFDFEADMDEFNLGDIKWLESKLGLKLMGRLTGTVSLMVNRLRPVQTSGKIDISFEDFKLAASEVTIAGSSLPLPEIIFSKGDSSGIKLAIDKGSANIEKFLFADGDFGLNLNGKIFISTVLANYRLNLNGSFKTSEQLKQALPFLFMVESQKQQDGSYPLSVAGKLSEPSIKVGNFTLPL